MAGIAFLVVVALPLIVHSLSMSLFAKRKGVKRPHTEVSSTTGKGVSEVESFESANPIPKSLVNGDLSDNGGESFDALGLCDWIQGACSAMGFKHPTPVQKHCIPAILAGKDVLGCAETGSGKTAAFALPILHDLSRDPYGIFAVVLTPTRELAAQISEQFGALGAPMGLRHAVIIGGVDSLKQSVDISKRPHVLVATPGRLRDHLQGPSPPDLSKIKYLVLDEADRLLSMGFKSEIRVLMEAVPTKRQTLLFSATMTDNIRQLEALAMDGPVKYDLTKIATVPATLKQQYLFMPSQMKACYLVELLRKVVDAKLLTGARSKKEESDEEDSGDSNGAQSVMIFVGSCVRCQQLCETLLQLGIDSVCLHSLMSQKRRMAALGKFKSTVTRIMVATDVCSRGLDIPDVNLVVNFDMPRVATDYVHRVGRSARAGRRGRAVSLVSQYDVELVHNVEEYVGTKLEECQDVLEKDVLRLLNPVAKASRAAKMRLMELGFDEKVEVAKRRKKSSNKPSEDS